MPIFVAGVEGSRRMKSAKPLGLMVLRTSDAATHRTFHFLGSNSV
jgi:hypothetical protein